ncbi:MAG: tetratricopeptide repeat protein [Bryobacteraceae bacterium]|jgi:tetratricopeptide (TPR) repeat protein
MWILLLLLWADPASFENTLRAGLEALHGNNLPVARARLEDASRMQPNNPQAWMGLAQTYWKLGLPDLARPAAAKAESAAPESPVVLHGLAYFYSETGEPGRAASLEARYAEKTPADREAFARAIDLYLQARQAKAAIALAAKALTVEDRADIHELLGEGYEMGGQPENAVAEMRKAIKLNAYDESYYFGLARLYLRHQNAEAAVEVLQEGRKVFARSPQLELALGVAYYGLRRFSDAADCFLRTTRMAPEVEQPYIFLGRMLDQAEDKLPQVTDAYAALVKSKPDDYLASFLYGKALSLASGGSGASGDRTRVETLFRKSIALKGDFWESHYELGILLERGRDFADAAGEFQRAIELSPSSPTPHYHLARVYERLGKKTDAAAEHAAHERLSAQETSAIRSQERALTPLELPSK